MSRIRNIARAFSREDGSVSAEAVLMTPLLIWAWIAMYVFFEQLRENNINLKAAYTVGDLLSRETDEVNMTYLEGMNDVFSWLTRTGNSTSMRVTVVRYDESDDQHDLVWSRGVDGAADLDQAAVDASLTPNIPIMADADTAIIIETWVTFEPIIDTWFTDTEIYNVIVTPPRFSEQLVFEGLGDGTGSSHDDGTSGGGV